MLKLFFFASLGAFLIACDKKAETPLVKLVEIPQKSEVLTTQTGAVQQGQGLFQAIKNVAIEDDSAALKLVNALRDHVEFSKLKVGDKLGATFNQDKELVEFFFSQNAAEKHQLRLNRATGEWDYSFIEEPTFWHSRMLEGELRANSTLQEDLMAKGLPRSIIAEVINVLLCKVNFRTDARMGDKFKILLNERMYQDSSVETQVLYTSYEGRVAGLSEAFYYQDEEKGSTYTAHYTEDGQALIHSGLRYPLSSLHVRSGYGYRRHPVTGRRAMHRGVDLRGRVGTPVHAVASGKVVASTYNKYAGNKVAIKHRDGSTSYYLHLNRRTVKVGSWVRSHQVIGTVGGTGRVTGPHLHFGFRKPSGQWMNPLKKRMIATPKLTGARLQKLKQQIAQTKILIQDMKLRKESKYLLAEFPHQMKLEEEKFEEQVLEMASNSFFIKSESNLTN